MRGLRGWRVHRSCYHKAVLKRALKRAVFGHLPLHPNARTRTSSSPHEHRVEPLGFGVHVGHSHQQRRKTPSPVT